MKPLDYLRARARRERKPATGGTVPAEEAVQIRIDNNHSRYTVPEMPAFLVQVDFSPREPTEAEAEFFRRQLQIMRRPRAPRSEPMLCPCVAIYSVCMCKNANIRAQTNPSDFRADQQ